MIRGDRIRVNDREEIPIIASTLSSLVGEVGILVATWTSHHHHHPAALNLPKLPNREVVEEAFFGKEIGWISTCRFPSFGSNPPPPTAGSHPTWPVT